MQYVRATVDVKTLVLGRWVTRDFLLFISASPGSRKRSLEEDEDFGAMQVAAAQNR